MEPKDLDDIPDELIERVLSTQGFQKMLKYSRLADSIDVLEEDDALFESMVTNVTNKHSSNIAEGTTREFFELFVEEVQTFTEPLVEEDATDDGVGADELEDIYVDETEDEP